MSQALAKSLEWGDRIPIGVFYQNPFIPTFEERIIETRAPSYAIIPPAKMKIAKEDGSPAVDLGGILKKYTV